KPGPQARSGLRPWHSPQEIASRSLPPEIVPLVVQFFALIGLEGELPVDAADAVEVIPPVRPAVPVPPIRVIARGEVIAVLEDIDLRDLAVRVGPVGRAEHVARDFQLRR